MIAVFTIFSISRGNIFSQKIQKFSICKNAFILSQTCKVFFRFSLKLTTVKVFYNVPQKKLRVRGHGQQPVPTVFQYSHSCKRICRSGFLPEFLFFYFRTHFDVCSVVCRLQRRWIFYLLQRSP